MPTTAWPRSALVAKRWGRNGAGARRIPTPLLSLRPLRGRSECPTMRSTEARHTDTCVWPSGRRRGGSAPALLPPRCRPLAAQLRRCSTQPLRGSRLALPPCGSLARRVVPVLVWRRSVWLGCRCGLGLGLAVSGVGEASCGGGEVFFVGLSCHAGFVWQVSSTHS